MLSTPPSGASSNSIFSILPCGKVTPGRTEPWGRSQESENLASESALWPLVSSIPSLYCHFLISKMRARKGLIATRCSSSPMPWWDEPPALRQETQGAGANREDNQKCSLPNLLPAITEARRVLQGQRTMLGIHYSYMCAGSNNFCSNCHPWRSSLSPSWQTKDSKCQ